VEELLALDRRLPGVLRGEAASPAEQLALARLCLRYKKHYTDALLLYERAFTAEPKRVEDLRKWHRYNAACAAVLAAGKGNWADPLGVPAQVRLRGRARAWLQADLAARARLLADKPASAGAVRKDLQHWLDDADLSGVRDVKELGALPREERQAWLKLW